ncbi:TPA: hypothetical protein RJR38_002722 [Burkholderia multivorans]|nr:hypothetical protein [Burkholderia multivorans]
MISDEQKQQAIRDGGASASSVRPFSIALGRIAAVPAMAAEAVAYVCSASNDFAPIMRDKGAAQRLSDAHSDGKIVSLYAGAQADARKALTDALRRAREELSIIEYENGPPARVTNLFSTIDALLGAHPGQPEPHETKTDLPRASEPRA